MPVPIFNLTAGATVDEGNNWVNISWGPLSLINPTTETNPSLETVIGNYSLAAGSPAIGYITLAGSGTTYTAAPADDFFGTLRKTNNAVDAGAVEFAGAAVAAPTLASIAPNSSTTAQRGTTVAVTLTGTNLTGGTINISGAGVTVSGTPVVTATQITANFAISSGAGNTGAHNVTVTTSGGTSNAVTFTKN